MPNHPSLRVLCLAVLLVCLTDTSASADLVATVAGSSCTLQTVGSSCFTDSAQEAGISIPISDTVQFGSASPFGGSLSANVIATFEVLSFSLAIGTPVGVAISLSLQGGASAATHPLAGVASFGVDWSGSPLSGGIGPLPPGTFETVSFSEASSEVITVPVGEPFSFPVSIFASSTGPPGSGGSSVGGDLTFGAGSFSPNAFVVDPSSGALAPAPTITPEPSSWLLFGLGLLGLAAFLKRRTNLL